MADGLSDEEIQELARVFYNLATARQVLDLAGLSRARHPEWVTGDIFWSEVATLLSAGVLLDGPVRLLAAARSKYPANSTFDEGVRRRANSAREAASQADRVHVAAGDSRGKINYQYSRVDGELRSILTRYGVSDSGCHDVDELAHAADAAGLIGSEQVNSIRGLSLLHQLVRHGRDVTEAEAAEYTTFADVAIYSMRNFHRSGRQPTG